jgi:hypothetical protein
MLTIRTFCQMIKEPSISSLFHELLHGPWPSEDPEFLAQVKHYGSILQRMLLLDSELSHYIRSQPLLDNDQIASVAVTNSVQKAQLIASVEPAAHQSLFQLTTSPMNIGRIFSAVKVEVGSKEFQYLNSDKPTETIRLTFDVNRATSLRVTCLWDLPVLKLSPVLQKLIGVPVALQCDIATRLLAHIDSKNLCDGSEVKCDALLTSLCGADRFEITSLSDIIDQNTQPMEPLSFVLDLPHSSRAFNIAFPEVTGREGPFVPVPVPPPPIRDFLEAALESKEQLLAMEAFERDPKDFVEEMIVREARMKDPTEFVSSSYFFADPWVTEAAADLLKSSEYAKGTPRKVQRPM